MWEKFSKCVWRASENILMSKSLVVIYKKYISTLIQLIQINSKTSIPAINSCICSFDKVNCFSSSLSGKFAYFNFIKYSFSVSFDTLTSDNFPIFKELFLRTLVMSESLSSYTLHKAKACSRGKPIYFLEDFS